MTRLISSVDRLTGNDRESVLIFDDSLFSRNRSKKVELLAKVFDHTTHKFFKGFRMLTLGWSDGNTFLSEFMVIISKFNLYRNLLQVLLLLHKHSHYAIIEIHAKVSLP